MLVWRKLASAKYEDRWAEQLEDFAGRMAVSGFPGAKRIRIEIYALAKSEAAALRGRFGGDVRAVDERSLIRGQGRREAIRIRGKLAVFESQAEADVARKTCGAKVLVIPASMAFGTGEHATTASCLRLLADSSTRHEARRWDMLDLGTGSGILALAAKLLGARRVDAVDFDPDAVRVARENAGLNAIAGVHFARHDVTAWTPPRVYDVVTANLFSEVLIRAAPRVARAVKPGGRLIFSGVMRSQEKECVAAMKRCGFGVVQTVRKGKWVTVLAHAR
jgi:ribosomal protein L11 methyltransferase